MNNAPIKDALMVEQIGPDRRASWPTSWANWFTQLLNALKGWSLSYTTTTAFDFGLIGAGAEASTTVTISGVRATSTPETTVTPSANVAGIIFTALVTADNTVTIYAKNFTTGGINPPSLTFRVQVRQ